MQALKECRQCKELYPATSEKFHIQYGRITSICRTCRREYERQYKDYIRNGGKNPATRKNLTRETVGLLVLKVLEDMKNRRNEAL